MYELSGSLRDEWRARVGAVKAVSQDSPCLVSTSVRADTIRKQDWMARIVPDSADSDSDAGEDDGDRATSNAADGAPPPTETSAVSAALDSAEIVSDPTAIVVPTIISDADSQEAMSSRVDAAVEKEFDERIAEAERRITQAAQRKEVMEMELFLGETVSNVGEV